MSKRKSSNSSWELRQHLKQYFVIVPPLMKTVSLSRYTALCKILFNNALEKHNKYDSSRDISSYRSAYVDFYKFQIIALERIPSHPDYKGIDPATKEWMSKSVEAAMKYLEDIVVRLDEDEDKNQLLLKEQALIDEFDSDPSSENVPVVVQSSTPSNIPLLLDNNGLIQSNQITTNNLQAETKATVIDRSVFQNRLASLLVIPEGKNNNNNVMVATMYDLAPSITYSSTPSLYDGGAALAVAVDDDIAISGLVGLFPSDIQIARLTLQYTKCVLNATACNEHYADSDRETLWLQFLRLRLSCLLCRIPATCSFRIANHEIGSRNKQPALYCYYYSWGQAENIPAAQKALLARAQANSEANLGKYIAGSQPSADGTLFVKGY
eukprot:gene30744-40891_t